jgi:dTDP-4-amino-4,6-dideoxygalactose transaminase
MQVLGYNYRVTDFQCALGLSQFKKLPGFVARRAEIVRRYNDALGEIESLITPQIPAARTAWHLYVLEFDLAQLDCDRRRIFEELRERKLGVQVHYIPVHLQPYYRETFGTRAGDYPNAERYYERAISLPLYPRMSDSDVERVIATVIEVVKSHNK